MFIAFEGIDGSGKSTILKMFEQFVLDSNLSKHFVFTREPGGKNLIVAEKIREIILDEKNEIDDLTEALLYVCSRNIHLNKIIIPSLKQNKIVISDRFVDSSLAYQGYAKNIGIEKIFNLNKIAIENYFPIYTFFFSIDPEIAYQRMVNKNQKLDRLEQKGLSFFKKVNDGYQKIINNNKYTNYIIIDASQSIENVFNDVLKNLKKIIKFL